MVIALYLAAFLLFALGCAHSYLGERYILVRLFRRGDFPKLFGDPEFTKRILRFAWHLTSVAWWGFAAILVFIAHPPVSAGTVGLVIGCTFLAHCCVALLGSRGRHLSWLVFLVVGMIAIYATGQ